MTILGVEPVIRRARLAIEERLATRMDEVAKAHADGFAVPLPRPGMVPDGDYMEYDGRHEDTVQFPAVAIYATAQTARSLEAAVVASSVSLRIRILDQAEEGHTQDMFRRVWRLEAAIRDILLYRASGLQTVENTVQLVAGNLWRASTYVQPRTGALQCDLEFDCRLHETA